MEIYVDKANLVSYAKSTSHTSFPDCNRMLKKSCKLRFTFNKTDIQGLPSEDKNAVLMWMTNMTQGIKEDFIWGDMFPERPLKSNCYNSFSHDQLFSVYLLDDEKSNTLKQNLLIAGVGEEVDTLSKLIIDEEDMYSKWENLRNHTGWEFIEKVHMPCTDIVIADPYILSDADLFEYNLYDFIPRLCSHLKDSKVNIVIFSLPEYNGLKPDLNKIATTIKNKVKAICRAKPNVTFIVSRGKEEHDRMIVTNYNAYVSGDTWNYFNSNYEVISKGRNLHIHSLAKKDNQQRVREFIKDLQGVINDLLLRNNPDLIQGDKKSLFLNLC